MKMTVLWNYYYVLKSIKTATLLEIKPSAKGLTSTNFFRICYTCHNLSDAALKLSGNTTL